MNYNLKDENTENKGDFISAFKNLYAFAKGSRIKIVVALILLLVNSVTIIVAPFLIGDVTNKYIPVGDLDNLWRGVLILAVIYIIGAVSRYFQVYIMGKVGQDILYKVRKTIFRKIQSLPLEFFNVNKSGDLISRINNDTDKLNQAFSETILRVVGNIVVIGGIGIAMILLNQTLGLVAFGTLGITLIFTFVLTSWIKRMNNNSLQKLGELSGEIQESLSNFKVTVVFNRRDYFKDAFSRVNKNNKTAATLAGIANGILAPIYSYTGSIASLIIVVLGIQLLIIDKVSVGMIPEFGTLITFILYSNSFFSPLRELGDLFTQIQTAIASWGRISKILKLDNNLVVIECDEKKHTDSLMVFDNVSFGYNVEKMILKDVSLDLKEGKTYALVGPTGGGKSTLANLMARLYDVNEGQVFFKGKDIRTYTQDELSQEIGFILQEPFLFSGTLFENIKYGNSSLDNYSIDQITKKLSELELDNLVNRFADKLETEIVGSGENISLGQKQLIAFVRAILRNPNLLILDEATANIDTVTEQILEDILTKLPKETTKVIIAHRLNTIENADQIFFISGGKVEKPLDFNSALGLINTSKNGS